MEGDTIQHKGRCIARCDPGYIPSSFELICNLGKLYPPSFFCTEVVDGFDHDSQLLNACRVSDAHKVDRLVGMRADLSFRSPGGDTALHLCALHSTPDTIRRLLLANAPTNAADARLWTPLHVAASRGHAAAVSELLAHGGDVALRNMAGATPGDLARTLAASAQPHLGQQTSATADVSLILMQAERLRSHSDCSNEQACPATSVQPWRPCYNTYDEGCLAEETVAVSSAASVQDPNLTVATMTVDAASSLAMPDSLANVTNGSNTSHEDLLTGSMDSIVSIDSIDGNASNDSLQR